MNKPGQFMSKEFIIPTDYQLKRIGAINAENTELEYSCYEVIIIYVMDIDLFLCVSILYLVHT